MKNFCVFVFGFVFLFAVVACKQDVKQGSADSDLALSRKQELRIQGLQESLETLQEKVQTRDEEIAELSNVIDEYISKLNGVYLEKESLRRQVEIAAGDLDFKIPKVVMFAGERLDLSTPKIREKFTKIFAQELKNSRNYISRSGFYFDFFEKIFAQEKAPQDLRYLAVAESALNPMARSWAGADGIWQFMPSTARSYNLRIDNFVDERRDIFKATKAAIRLLKFNKKYLAKKGVDSWLLAMCAYNAGVGNISRAIRKQGGKAFSELIMSAEETNRYVWRAVAIKIIFDHEKEIFGELIKRHDPIEKQFKRVKITLRGYHKLDKWAIAQGTNISMVWQNNYWIKIYKHRRSRYAKVNNVILPFGDYEFWIPKDAQTNFKLLKEAKARLAKKDDAINIYYRVKKNDNLVKIAKKFKTYTNIIRKENKMKSNRIIPGQILTINGRYIKGDYVYSKKNYYRIRKGDSLEKVAKKLKVSANYLVNMNKLEKRYVLPPGKKLVY